MLYELLVGVMAILDNVLQSAKAMKGYLKYVQNNPDYEIVIACASEDKDDGISIIQNQVVPH